MNGTKSLINCHGPQNSLWLIAGRPCLQIKNIILHDNEITHYALNGYQLVSPIKSKQQIGKLMGQVIRGFQYLQKLYHGLDIGSE